MTLASTAIVVSGLPASGKTSVGRRLAADLGWPLLDKDDFLETLYEAHPVATMEDRRRLSRLSDGWFQEAAARHDQVVLISHWTPSNGTGATGTSTDWITDSFARIIEVYCECPADVAAQRFKSRGRHPGHLDHLRSVLDVAQQMQSLLGGYPLGLGVTLCVKTDRPLDAAGLLDQISAVLET